MVIEININTCYVTTKKLISIIQRKMTYKLDFNKVRYICEQHFIKICAAV